jgi:hypothetical protein
MLLSHERRNGTLLPKLVCKSKIAAIATPNNQVAMSSSALIIVHCDRDASPCR